MIKNVRQLFKEIHQGKRADLIPIFNEDMGLWAVLRPLNIGISNQEVKLLKEWRINNQDVFLDEKLPTIKGTREWFLAFKDRILFMIEDNNPIGHMGLFRLNEKEDSVEIDNVVRGVDRERGIMTGALHSLIVWTQEYIKPKHIYLQVLKTNKHAVDFYLRNGFEIVGDITHNGYQEYKMEYV